MRTCVICGVGIEHRDPQCITCGPEHRAKARYQRRKEARSKANPDARAPKACRHCGSPVVGRARQAKFCSPACLFEATRIREKQERRVRRLGTADLDEPIVRVCAECGADFECTAYSKAKYCDGLCKKRAEKRRWREKIALYRVAYPSRYRDHRLRENQRRADARAALTLIREIETKGLEALL